MSYGGSLEEVSGAKGREVEQRERWLGSRQMLEVESRDSLTAGCSIV